MDEVNGPEFRADEYNRPGIIKTHNCYDYAIGNFNPDQKKKSQPGRTKLGNDLQGEEVYTCKVVEDRLLIDHPELIFSSLTGQCPHGYHKIGMMIDPDDDYHFIRQDDDGYWSHKPGGDRVIDTDFSGRRIVDPEQSDFNHTQAGLHYTQFCNYYCVKEDGHFQEAIKK